MVLVRTLLGNDRLNEDAETGLVPLLLGIDEIDQEV